MSKIKEFADTLAALKAVNKRRSRLYNHGEDNAYLCELHERVEELYLEQNPRRSKLLSWDDFEKYFDPDRRWYTPGADAIRREIRCRAAIEYNWCRWLSNWYEHCLRILAAEVKPSDLKTLGSVASIHRKVDSGDYHSQGYGATSYAKKAAEKAMLAAEYHEIDCAITQYEKTWKSASSFRRGTNRTVYFQVWVQLDYIGKEILRRMPGPSMREVVRWCWDNHVNPRVYYPFLPVGYEEKTEIDYFGNDLREEASA